MNTKPVDVIEVMDDVILRLLYSDKELAQRANNALLAIAELIAADEEYDAAITAQYRSKSRAAWLKSEKRVDAAFDRRAAALARVKGEV